MRRSWNGQALWEGGCLLAFAGVLAYWLGSDIYRNYVTPRLFWPLVLAAGMTLLWGLQRLREAQGRQYRNSYRYGWIFIVPTLGLLFSCTPGALAATPSAQTASQAQPIPVGENFSSAIAATADGSAAYGADETGSAGRVGIGAARHAVTGTSMSPLEFQTDTYYKTLIHTTQDLDAMLGRPVVITGFVVRDPRLYTRGDFIIARWAMTCCIADVAPLGLVVFVDHPEQYETGKWYRIEGRLRANSFHGMNQAAVDVTRITPAAPIPGYVYP